MNIGIFPFGVVILNDLSRVELNWNGLIDDGGFTDGDGGDNNIGRCVMNNSSIGLVRKLGFAPTRMQENDVADEGYNDK